MSQHILHTFKVDDDFARRGGLLIPELYVDGGVIGSNPSMIGGTWACRLIWRYDQSLDFSGVVQPHQVTHAFEPVSNNQTEMLALLEGLRRLPDGFCGTIYSDSQVTLGRAFMGWKWNNIPSWMHVVYQQHRKRLKHWAEIKYVLLDGHPTRAQLAAGTGKRGHPVSIHNVWCDRACKKAGETFLAGVGKNIPSATEESAYV